MQQAYTNRIIDDDRWLRMLKVRNQLAHDYDGSYAKEKFGEIIREFCPLFEKLQGDVEKYYAEG